MELNTSGTAATTAVARTSGVRDEIVEQTTKALEISQPSERMAAFQRLLAETTDVAGINGILDAFQALFRKGRRFDSEWKAFWHGIARRDAQSTLALIASHGSDTSWNATALNMTLNEWAGKDPRAAVAWLSAHQSELRDTSLDDATLGLIVGYADHDLDAASEYALTVIKPDDPMSDRVTAALAQRVLQQRGSDGMIDWFKGLTNDDQRHRMFRSVADKLGSVSLDHKIAWLTAQARTGFRDDNSYRDAANQIAQRDPRAGMEFVVQVGRSPKDGGFPGIGAASFAWLMQSRQDFTTWFNALPVGDVRDNVLRALNNSLTNDSKLASDKRQQAVEFLQTAGR